MTVEELIESLKTPKDPIVNADLVKEVVQRIAEDFNPLLVDAAEQCFGLPYYRIAEIARGIRVSREPDLANEKLHNTILKSYLELTQNNEAPGHFHALAALSSVGAAIGTQVWVNMGYYKVYPPMAVLLVGPSGIRKSVAIAISQNLLEPFDELQVFRDRFTIEGLISYVKDGAKVLLVASELAATFGRAKYLEDLIPLITRMLDQEGIEFTTKGAGRFKLSNVAFGLLSASTVDWLLNELPNGAVTGGFLGRFLIGYARSTDRYSYRTEDITDKVKSLGNYVAESVKRVSGEFKLSAEADRWLERWYKASKDANNDPLLGPALGSYYNRRLVHIIRIALVLSVMAGKNKITTEDVLDANKLLSFIEPGHVNVLAQVTGSTTHRDLITIAAEIPPDGIPVEKLVHIGCVFMGYQRFKEALSLGTNSKLILNKNGKYHLRLDSVSPAIRKAIMARREDDV